MVKKKRIGLRYKSKKIFVNVEECRRFSRIRGLMFTNIRKARALLFNFNRPTKLAIHSIFVFFPFIAIWLDDKNKIIDLKFVKPFTLSIRAKKPFSKLIEIPNNRRYREIVKLLVGDKKDL